MTRGITTPLYHHKHNNHHHHHQRPYNPSFNVVENYANHEDQDDNNRNNEVEEETSDIDSPTKQYKGMVSTATNMKNTKSNNYYNNSMMMMITTATPPSASASSTNTSTNTSSTSRPLRTFGEELEPTNNRVIIDNTSLLLRMSEEQESSTNNQHKDGLSSISPSIPDDISAGTTSSQGSSVAHLRGLLDDFGKQQKQHYEKNTAVGQTPSGAQRPTRPKVGGTSKRPNQNNKATPLPGPAASALARRLVDTTTGLPATATRRHPRATPIRIQTKEPGVDVRATNEGYKSVKELSAWLADDPTKAKKKVKCLRRGANVIAKSRAFDKGLKDVIIEQDLGLRSIKGLVASKKQLLATESGRSFDNTSTSDRTDSNKKHSGNNDWEETENINAQPQWPVPDSMETSSVICVSDKKQWLANAFKKADGVVTTAPKAHTEVVTAQDEREAVSNRAKHMWRQRASKAKTTDSTTPPTTFTQKSIAARKSITAASATNKQVIVSQSAVENTERQIDTTDPPAPETTKNDVEKNDSPTKYGFSAARDFLVQKARQNGNPVDVNEIKNRKTKFEQLERRRSTTQSTLHKTAWVEAPQNSAFVRTVVPNTAPKKSMEELP